MLRYSILFLVGFSLLACSRNEQRHVRELDFGIVRHTDSLEAIQKHRAFMQRRFQNLYGEDSLTNMPTIASYVSQMDTLSMLHKSLTTCGVDSVLQLNGPYTLFAPDNAAFSKLPGGTMLNLLQAESNKKLTHMMQYHVVPGLYKADQLETGMKLTTLLGQNLTITVNDTLITVADPKGAVANIIKANVRTGNGYIHRVDAVKIPG